MDLSVSIRGKVMPNPVGVASGTFGYAKEYEHLVDLSVLGAVYTKAVTPLPRTGNPQPRLVETPAGMLNSIGLANVGVQEFIAHKLPFLVSHSFATIVNVAGSTEQDYEDVVRALEGAEGIWGYEINVSCPNVKTGGIAFGTDPALVESLTRKLRVLTDRPLIIKLSPNVTDITLTAKAAENGGADAVSAINTLKGMVIDIHKKKPVLPFGTGGLSGPAILPVGVAMVYSIKRAVSIPVIGLGGIMQASDAIQYLLAGASAIQVGAGTFVKPRLAEEVWAGIQNYAQSQKISKISDFHGLIP